MCVFYVSQYMLYKGWKISFGIIFPPPLLLKQPHPILILHYRTCKNNNPRLQAKNQTWREKIKLKRKNLQIWISNIWIRSLLAIYVFSISG